MLKFPFYYEFSPFAFISETRNPFDVPFSFLILASFECQMVVNLHLRFVTASVLSDV